MKHEFELLAPAGSFEILKAVIEAGADAVYVGGSHFGARAYANNFTEEELLEAIDYVHLRGKKLFLTVNTLFKNIEIQEQLYEYLLPYYEKGLDAVIVQDFGAIAFIKEHFPDLPVHTSTQMTVTGAEGAKLMKELGAERVVLARELSIEEMQRIRREADIELEAFIHGALCYSYSGQCLFSSLLGGRSGNRGRCAQPCRLSYAVLDEHKKEVGKDSYILSLKDLCGIEYLQQLREAGVYSLKIEGRMKQASYAAGVVALYRKYIDLEKQVSKEDMQNLRDLGNRDGFTTEYFRKHNDKGMITFVKPSYEKSNEALHQKVEQQYVGVKRQLPVCGTLFIRKGEPLTFAVSHGEIQVCMTLGEAQAAKNKPLEVSDVMERMKKTGESAFYFEDLQIKMDTDVFVPNGVLNQLRRDTLAKLEAELLSGFLREHKICPETSKYSDTESSKRRGVDTADKLIASCETRAQFDVLCRAEDITTLYVDAQMYTNAAMLDELSQDVRMVHNTGKEILLRLPAIFRTHTAAFYQSNIGLIRHCGLDGMVVRNYEELYFCQKELPEISLVIDYNMYTYNDYAKQAFYQMFEKENATLLRDTVPLELNRKEIRGRDNTASEMVVYGHYPLMVSAGCVHKNAASCDKHARISYLKDRYHVLFPVKNYCRDCYNIIYNSVPVLLFREKERLNGYGIRHFRLEFTIETAGEVQNVLDLLRGKGKEIDFTKGHYKRGVE